MGFEIDLQNQFVENTDGPIQIDSRVSLEEKEALENALEGEKDDIYDTTNGQLAILLHEDIMQNIGDFSPEVQEDLLVLAEKYPHTSIDLGIQIPGELEETLSQGDLDLSIQRAVSDLENFAASDLALPSDSYLSPEEHSAIIANMGMMIQSDIDGVENVIQETVDDNPDLSMRELTWMINSKIQNYFKNIRDNLILPVKALLDFSSELKQQELFENIGAGASRDNWSPDRIQRAQQNLFMNMEMLKEALLTEGSTIDDIGYQYELLRDSEFNLDDFDLETNIGVDENLDISLLNEEDKQIESQAMFYFMCAVGFQCLPYVGAAPGIVADGVDIFSSEDATLMFLKESGLVPEEYHMDKTWIDNALAGLGIALTGVGLQGLAKSGKLSRAIRGIGNMSSSLMSSSLSRFISEMNIGDEAADMLRGIMGLEGESADDISEVANLNRIPNSLQETSSGLERSIRHTPESYLEIGGRSNEYGFVDTDGQLHINTEAFDELSSSEKAQVMREFIAHERAHQAIMNLPEGKLADIHESFLRNNVFLVIQDAERFGLHFDRAMSPLDTTNEILAHLIGRMRVGKDVPESFLVALGEVGIDDITGTFGVNASRNGWNEIGGVRNTDDLSEAAMSQGGENYFEINSFTLRTIRSHSPEFADLLNTLHERGGDIGEALGKINFSQDNVKSAISTSISQINGLITKNDIEKIQRYLESNGKTFPEGLDMDDIKREGDTGITEGFLENLFTLLEEINSQEVPDEIDSQMADVIEAAIPFNQGEGIVSNLDSISMRHPEVVEFFDALIDDTEEITVALSRINFRNESVYDAIDFLITNSHGIISEDKLDEIARSVGKQRSEIIGDLEFTDGEAGITEEFLQGVFRFHEEALTGVSVSNDPFEMNSIHLARLAKNHFGEIGESIAEYIRQSPNLQNAIQSLENADYHNPDFLLQSISEIGDFYDNFGEEATRKLIAEVFGKGETDFNKLFANITRFDEALNIARSKRQERFTQIFEGIGLNGVSTTMTQRLERVEQLIQSDWFDGNPDTLAFMIGNDLSASGLYAEIGQEKFIQLLSELGINIPDEGFDDFYSTIESLETYKIAKSVTEAQISSMLRSRENMPQLISSLRGNTLSRPDLLSILESNSPRAYDFIKNIDTGWIGNQREILIINGETISKISRNKITPELLAQLENGGISEIKNHPLDSNALSVTMISFQNLVN